MQICKTKTFERVLGHKMALGLIREALHQGRKLKYILRNYILIFLKGSPYKIKIDIFDPKEK